MSWNSVGSGVSGGFDWYRLWDGNFHHELPPHTNTHSNRTAFDYGAHGAAITNDDTSSSPNYGTFEIFGSGGDNYHFQRPSKSLIFSCVASFEKDIDQFDSLVAMGAGRESDFRFGLTYEGTAFTPFGYHSNEDDTGVVRVDDGTDEYIESLDYPDMTDINVFTILIDMDGLFLDKEQTGFYVNGDPRNDDSPDVIIDTVQAQSSSWDPDHFGFNHMFHEDDTSDVSMVHSMAIDLKV